MDYLSAALFDTPEEHLESARHYRQIGEFTRSLEHYFAYCERTPTEQRAENSEDECIELLCDIEALIKEITSVEELMKCFVYGLQLFPNNSKFHNRFGSLLIKKGDYDHGVEFIHKAYEIAKKNREPSLAIEKNMLHLKWKAMPRWHFRMLNGKLRNESYRKAIQKALHEGLTSVADIGSGCGLLSLYAEGAKNVVAFEANANLHKKCSKLMSKNFPRIDYYCHKNYSYKLDNMEKPPRDLIITEIFDVAVFGEGILKTLSHVYYKNWVKDSFRIIPAKVTLYVTGIACASLDKKYRLCNSIPSLQLVDICARSENVSYDAESLRHHEYRLMTETEELMTVDFSDRSLVNALLASDEKTFSNIVLEGVRTGHIDSLVVWFDLHLDDEIFISTNPFHALYEPCWEQAIFHCHNPVEISSGDKLSLNVLVAREKLELNLVDSISCPLSSCFRLSEQCIRFLNDKEWIDYLMSFSDLILENKKLTICDFSTFPLLGLLFAKKGHTVYYFCKNFSDAVFVRYLITKNDIDFSHIIIVEYNLYHVCISNISEKLDYILYEPVCYDGSLNTAPISNIMLGKQRFQTQLVFENVTIHFMLIYSSYLDYCNRVDPKNVKPFDDVAEEMNEYSGSEHPDLPLDFPHEKMSNEHIWNPNENPRHIESVTISKYGKVNGILTWFTIVGMNGNKFCTKESSYFNKNVLFLPDTSVEPQEIRKMLCQYEKGPVFKIEFSQDDF
ncbi:hypothetical protein HHI36_010121 [Cryptolaemus montrouzieri]|uniref:Protein arginine N-methyltransferase domain-containing protein n=1 Tax=Cryptolaemus montrouzieri TaxID=559131 RepID=A0ABD2MI89_9CUCU